MSQNSVDRVLHSIDGSELRHVFIAMCSKAKEHRTKGFDWFLLLPNSIREKQEIDELVTMGVIRVADSDFRMDPVTSRIKANEVICGITEIGKQVAVSMGQWED